MDSVIRCARRVGRVVAIGLCLTAFQAHGAGDRQRGLDIATAADRMDHGFADSVVELEMLLNNAAGGTASRRLTIYTLEVPGDGDKSIARFDSPRDVKGTALLTWSHGLEADDQWLYLPSLSRVKRVSSKNKSGSFMGSEFAFEDLSSQELEKYDYAWLRDERIDGIDSYVLQRIPLYENSGYSRQVLWLDKSNYNVLRTQYYDRGQRLLKTLTLSGYRQYHGRFWRAQRMEMVNEQNGKSTTLLWDEYRFGNRLNASTFSKNRLKSLR